ncbi:MAG: phenylalanine--tRNA ligase subunit alpha [Verrucomicrobiota bacterium]
MQEKIDALQAEVLAAIQAAENPAALEEVRVAYLSRNGQVPALLAGMKDVPKEERPIVGKRINELKSAVEAAFDGRKSALEDAAGEGGDHDPTLPGRMPPHGTLHPVLALRDRCIAIFRRLGYALAEGPDIDTEWHNFDALNTPADHPARNEQDTFYLDETGLDSLPPLEPAGEGPAPALGRRLLRTHTSTVQIRTMLRQKPPVRIIAPGRCYRRDEIDATHLMSFTQCEGLAVDEGVSLADMKGTLEFFFRELLGPDIVIRFRPHFFPFTEPSFEFDISRPGQTIKGKQWLELGGCGMVDPEVLIAVGIDPEQYTGWAFGFGLERLPLVLHAIPDIRAFVENDVRFLQQLG